MPAEALIGPNAVLQLVPVLDHTCGPAQRQRLLRDAGIIHLPDGSRMIPEALPARLLMALRAALPEQAPGIAAEAGRRTADYLIAHRIPGRAKWLLGHLPRALAAELLSRAIARHAWTFAGSGRFRIAARRPRTFEITANPLASGEAVEPLCHWHTAVFEGLFQTLVDPRVQVRETGCCAAGDSACRFVLARP